MFVTELRWSSHIFADICQHTTKYQISNRQHSKTIESSSSNSLLPLPANLNKVCQSSDNFFQLRPVQLSILFLIQSLPTAAILLRLIPLAATTVRHNLSGGKMNAWVQRNLTRGAEVKLSMRIVAKICQISAISDCCQL